MNFIPQAIGAVTGLFGGGGGLAGLGSLAAGALKAVGGVPGALSLGSSALGAFSQFSAGLADKREAELAAERETLGATQEWLRGRQSENEILDRLLDTVAQQRVAFAASGVDPSIGTPAAVTRDSVQRGERAGRVATGNAYANWFTRRQTAAAYRKSGRSYGLGGLVQSVANVGGAIAGVLKRG